MGSGKIETCTLEILKRDEPFTIPGTKIFVAGGEPLQEKGWMKPLPMDRYTANQDALEAAEREGLITIHISSNDADGVPGENSKSTSSRSRAGGKTYTAAQIEKSVKADHGTFSRFLRAISGNEEYLSEAQRIAEAENFAIKTREIKKALDMLRRRDTIKRI